MTILTYDEVRELLRSNASLRAELASARGWTRRWHASARRHRARACGWKMLCDKLDARAASLESALLLAATHVLDATLMLEELCSPTDCEETVAEARGLVAEWRALVAGATGGELKTKEGA